MNRIHLFISSLPFSKNFAMFRYDGFFSEKVLTQTAKGAIIICVDSDKRQQEHDSVAQLD